MPVNYYFTTRDLGGNKLFDSIMKWDKKKYIMAAACHKNYHGLTEGHAYTVVGGAVVNG
jgi:hypothetical protein